MIGAQEGGVFLRIGGEPRRLAFKWRVLVTLKRELGNEFSEHISVALTTWDFETIARLVSMASGGVVTPDQVIEESPPVVATVSALSRALSIAYHGPEALASESPLARAARVVDSMIASAIQFARRLTNGLALGAMPKTSLT